MCYFYKNMGILMVLSPAREMEIKPISSFCMERFEYLVFIMNPSLRLSPAKDCWGLKVLRPLQGALSILQHLLHI